MNEGSGALAPALRRLLEATASVTGVEFFETLALTLTEVVGFRCAFLAETLPNGHARSLAFVQGGLVCPAFTYELAGTPCEAVLNHGFVVHAGRVAALYPADSRLREWGTESYVGVAFQDSHGTPLGLLAALHERPLLDAVEVETLLRTFALRAGAEVQRTQFERQLRQQTQLAEASAAISTTLNDLSRGTSAALQQICDLVRAALDISGVSVVLLDSQATKLELAAQSGLDAELLQRHLPALTERFLRHATHFEPIAIVEDLRSLRDAQERALYDALDLRSAASALIGPSGRPSGLLSVVTVGVSRQFGTAEIQFLRMIADRLGQAVDALRLHDMISASEARYRSIVTTCMEGVWTIDADGNTTFVNPQMAQMLGYEVEEMVGRPLSAFMDDAGRHQASANLERRRHGIRERHEFRFLKKGGAELWTILSTTPLMDDSGRFVGALALATDVTERRGLELKIQQTQKLESLGMLAGGVAHDFNNLLVGILGNVGIALLELPLESPVMPVLADIQSAALRAAELTKQMLAYSGRGRFVIQRLNLTRLVEETTHLLATVISKKANLRFNLAAELPEIEADATQIRQVLMNLLTNASDSLDERSGSLAISTGVVHVDRNYLRHTYLDEELPEGDYVFLEVSDTGSGITRDTVDRIFDPFYTTKFTGRGLGLAAVLGILRGHRGAIKVYSEPGHGSTFKVLIPAAPASSGSEPLAQREALSFAGTGTILIADDEESVRSVARRVLRQVGFDILLAADGREAVRMYSENIDKIVAVLLDMTMPELGGEEVFRELRRIRPDVRVVLSSGYNEQDATAHFIGKGLAGFLQKPWVPADLLEAMRRALAG